MEYHTPLVSAETLSQHVDDPNWVVFDCRHALSNPDAGPKDYAKGHIPGAWHAHVDNHLAGPVGTGEKGRHPLPLAGAFVRFLQTYGVNPESQVVCYDDAGGMWAARMWWLLRHYGHSNVAVLDGGLARWKALHLPLDSAHKRQPAPGTFAGKPGSMPISDTATIEAGIPDICLVDARAPERFAGTEEPMDPVAGHIPGAVNLPFAGNLASDGRFLSPDELRARFAEHEGAIMYCGSGVTAAHNVLACEIAGLPTPALYPGSWSQWCHPSSSRPTA